MVFIFIGLVAILALTFALMCFMLMLRLPKEYPGRKLVGLGGFIFLISPLILFFLFQNNSDNEQNQYIGTYENILTGNHLDLNEDMTWKSDPLLFACTSGKWEYTHTEDMNLIELYFDCEGINYSEQILNCEQERLQIKPGIELEKK